MEKREYIARVNRVIDHIRVNLETDLSLETLSEIASFSPFHFHRIFKVLVGENLNDFVRRLRLEKAASLLRFSPNRSVTEIALDSGFSSSSVFARASFNRLAKYLLARDLLTRESLCVGVLHDNLAITPDQKRAYDSAFTVPAHFTEAGGEVGLQEIPGARYAICRITQENEDGAGQKRAIQELGQVASYLYGTWLPESGYELVNQPGLEIYHSNRPVFSVDLCLPVRPV